MSKPYVRTATADDAAELAISMRDDDLRELAIGGSPGPYEALLRGIVNSDEAYTLIGKHGEVAAMGGVVGLSPVIGSPWMLGADTIEDIAIPFLRLSRAHLHAAHTRYPHLYNQVWEGNVTHIRWLKWLGFTVSEAPKDRPHFLPFWRTNV
jgi:Protein of unknown function (DUF2833)